MRRKFSSFVALPLSFLLGVCSQIAWLSSSSSLNQYELDSSYLRISYLDITGPYYPAHELPWEFSNIERIDMTTADHRFNATDMSVSRRPISPEGYLMTGINVYGMSSLNVSDGRISFTTKSNLGVSYQFTGRMLEGNFPIKGYSEYFIGRTIMVEGRLVKTLWGWKIAEGDMSFTKGGGE
jgi:hypothetical protein